MFDTMVLGGSYDGLFTAMYIARSRHTVAILDGGLTRNRFSSNAHTIFGFDGLKPTETLSTIAISSNNTGGGSGQ